MWIFFVDATNDFGPVVIYKVFTAVFLAFLFCVFMVVLLWRNNIHVNIQASIFACSMGPTPSTFQANEVSIHPRPQHKPALTDFDLQLLLSYRQRSPSPPFNGLHHRNPRKHMDYYSLTDPRGMEG